MYRISLANNNNARFRRSTKDQTGVVEPFVMRHSIKYVIAVSAIDVTSYRNIPGKLVTARLVLKALAKKGPKNTDISGFCVRVSA